MTSVYCLLRIDPAMTKSTRVHCQGGRCLVWNEVLVFSLGEDVRLFPHFAINVKIARIKSMKEKLVDPDVVKFQLTTPSGHVRGSISLTISPVQTGAKEYQDGANTVR